MTVIRPAIDAAVRAAVRSSNPSDTNLPKQLTRGLWAAALVLGLSTVAQAQDKPADQQTATRGQPRRDHRHRFAHQAHQ